MQTIKIHPNNPEAQLTFQHMCAATNNETPIVKMNDITAKNIEIIWQSVNSLGVSWRGEREMHIPNYPIERKLFWGEFAKNPHEILPLIEEFILETPGEGKVAIDLGCGNSPEIPKLLQKGWKVIAVDNSHLALIILASQNRDKIQSGQLVIIEADITEFIPSEQVDLVIAADVFPYINPNKFQQTWMNINRFFLKKNGFLIGNLFRYIDELSIMNLMKEMGAWFLPTTKCKIPFEYM